MLKSVNSDYAWPTTLENRPTQIGDQPTDSPGFMHHCFLINNMMMMMTMMMMKMTATMTMAMTTTTIMMLPF